jgi:hypothetical protein
MTQDEVIEMARQVASHGVEDHRSGEVSYVFYNEHLMNFAKLVAQHEREACVKVCKEMRTYVGRNNAVTQSSAQDCVTAIRARGQA